MTEYHEANDAENKAILQSLVNNTDDDETKKVISCYTIEATGTEIIKKLSLLNVPPLKKAAAYLGIPEKTTKTKKADIISVILDRLNALLRELCGICGEYYNEDLNDPPLITCIICKQGCHNICQKPIIELLGDLTAKQQKSRPFMCSSCIGEYNDEDSEVVIVKTSKSKSSPTKIKEVKPFNDNHSKHEAEQQQDDDTIPTAPPKSPDKSEAEQQQDDVTIPTAPPKSPGKSENPSPSNQTVAVPPTKNQIEICPAYEWGRCQNFENCQYRHPPRCWKWLENARCSYKDKCKYHHPKICNSSLARRQCFNDRCKYFHLTRTIRQKMENEQLMSSLQPLNYHAQSSQNAQINHNPVPPLLQSAQFPPLPQAQWSQANMNQPLLANVQPQPLQPQPTQQVHQTRSKLSEGELSFLAKAIKEAIKGDLAVEIANIRKELNQQVQKPYAPQPQVINNPHMIQGAPTLYRYPVQGMTVNHQPIHPPQ